MTMPPMRHAPITASVRSPVAASSPVVFLVMTFVVVASVLGEGSGVGAGVGVGSTAAEPKLMVPASEAILLSQPFCPISALSADSQVPHSVCLVAFAKVGKSVVLVMM